MAEASGGSELTPERVFRDFAPRVYHLARRMLGNDADAEDVAQDVMLQVVRKLGSFRGEADVGTWLHRVTVNAVLLHRHRAARRSEFQLDTPPDHLPCGAAGNGPARPRAAAPDRQLLRRELREQIERAIGSLPPLYRDVYVLADAEGYSNAEIGARLGLGLAAVKSRLHRARLQMRSALAPYFPEAG